MKCQSWHVDLNVNEVIRQYANIAIEEVTKIGDSHEPSVANGVQTNGQGLHRFEPEMSNRLWN